LPIIGGIVRYNTKTRKGKEIPEKIERGGEKERKGKKSKSGKGEEITSRSN